MPCSLDEGCKETNETNKKQLDDRVVYHHLIWSVTCFRIAVNSGLVTLRG